MLPANRRDQWLTLGGTALDRWVAPGIAVLGALSFGAVALSYGYGIGGGGGAVYPQSVAAFADFRAELDLTAYRLKGVASTDTVKVGIPLAVGFLDSAQAAIDSVSCVVEGTEVGCHVDVRETPNDAWPALWQSDASVRILEVAIPITAADTALKLRFGDATVDARMTEPSWVPTPNLDSANIIGGDSIGHYPELSGYHKTIAWCTDPQVCLDTKGYGTIGVKHSTLEAAATASLPYDTSIARFECYGDLTYDGTVSCGQTGADALPVVDAFVDITVTNDSANYDNGLLSTATNKYAKWREALGITTGAASTSENFYDRGWLQVMWGMAGGPETYFARGLSVVWHYYNLFWDCNQNGYNGNCTSGYLRWNPESALHYYWFTGDTISAGTLVQQADQCRSKIADMGQEDKTEGEPRPMAKCILAVSNAHLLGDTSQDWDLTADSVVNKALSGTANQGDGTWRISVNSGYSKCIQPDSALAYNSFMHPLMVDALMRYDEEVGTYSLGFARDSLIAQVTRTATFFHPDSSEWFDDGPRNFFTASNCTPDNSWRNNSNNAANPPDSSRWNLAPMYAEMMYLMYAETSTPSWLAAGDTIFRRATTTTSVTVKTQDGPKDDNPYVRNRKELAEGWMWLVRGWARRAEAVGS